MRYFRLPPLMRGQIDCSETSVWNYHFTPRKISKERRYRDRKG